MCGNNNMSLTNPNKLRSVVGVRCIFFIQPMAGNAKSISPIANANKKYFGLMKTLAALARLANKKSELGKRCVSSQNKPDLCSITVCHLLDKSVFYDCSA